MASFWKPEACGQTVLPDMSVFIGQKLVENAKMQKLKCDILSNFQTMCDSINSQCEFFRCKCGEVVGVWTLTWEAALASEVN